MEKKRHIQHFVVNVVHLIHPRVFTVTVYQLKSGCSLNDINYEWSCVVAELLSVNKRTAVNWISVFNYFKIIFNKRLKSIKQTMLFSVKMFGMSDFLLRKNANIQQQTCYNVKLTWHGWCVMFILNKKSLFAY